MTAPVAIGSRAAPAVGVGHWRRARLRLRRDRVAVVSGTFLLVLLFAVLPGAPLAGKILGHGPNDFFPYAVSTVLRPVGPLTRVPDTPFLAEEGNPLSLKHAPPAPGTGKTLFLLGADGRLGRDEFLRLLYGGRVSLEVAVGAALVALLVGSALGSLAGYYGGIVDAIVSRFTDLVMAFPVLLFLILVGSQYDGLTEWTLHGLLNKGVLQLILLIGVFTWFYPARIVRAQMLSLRQTEFVEAAAMIGARDRRIIRTHLLPHVLPSLIVYGTLLVATNVMLEVGVTFLGAGIKLPTSSWGSMLAQTWGSILNPSPYNPATTQPWLTIIPSAAIFLTVFSLNQLGEGLREALDPNASRR